MTVPSKYGRRLLVVDDEPIQRLIIARGVEAIGFHVDGADSLTMASDRLAEACYDVVVLDLSLGEAEGISLLQVVRNSRSDPVVIVVSRLDDRVRTATARLAMALGLRVAGALAKPVSIRALIALLRDMPARIAVGPSVTFTPPTAAALREAVEADEIVPRFQPKVSLRDGSVIGVEALARWMPEPGSSVAPDVFIPLAEQAGLIGRLTAQMLRRSLEACRRWRRTFPVCGVAVNISPMVLADPGLPEAIEQALRDHSLGPGALVAEITESTVIDNPLIAAEVLTRLRIKGVSLSIDDFGTGHSSLLTLLRLPFSELKIDRSFVGHCDSDPEAWKIVRATISMARELGLQVVAEGIETPVVAAMLRDVGCDVGQGWLYGKAMSEDELMQWMSARAVEAA